MILDYYYNKRRRVLEISYINKNGAKSIVQYNINKFKTWIADPNGSEMNWDGRKCSSGYTESPHKFDIKKFILDLPESEREIFNSKQFPKLYTWDIEVNANPSEFPVPSLAKEEITTISICSPEFNSIVLGTRELSDIEMTELNNKYIKYISDVEFWNKLNIPTPTCKYIKFPDEHGMLEYFLRLIKKAPVMAGWNSDGFDLNYIANRIKNNYKDLSMFAASATGSISQKSVTDWRANKTYLPIPNHTLMLDLMNVIKDEDFVVMPIKESMSLDYIAEESLGVKKIEYDGGLWDLLRDDYPNYVFYNAVDSLLVQLINQRFKTMNNIYIYSQYCTEKIGSCFSKISLSEALVFKDFYDRGINIIPEKLEREDRGTLIGAYVREPVPGLHSYITCNDFASLYPSSITTCNLSFENYLGHNFSEEELEIFKSKKEYFVSVNNNVYKNDKDYTFKNIQKTLKSARDVSKYLSKQLDAEVLSFIDSTIRSKTETNYKLKLPKKAWNDHILEVLKEFGVQTVDDIINKDISFLEEFRSSLALTISFYTSNEQAMKLLANSLYGGSSHPAFYWFNMDLANDITGESRSLIHMMEEHLSNYWKENWVKMKDLHEKWGIVVNEEKANRIFSDPDYGCMVYGDTDSVTGESMIRLSSGEELKIEELYNNNIENSAGITKHGHESVWIKENVMNWDKELYFGSPKRIIRHKVTKPKWRLKTSSGKEITMTSDHSMIVFRDGEKLSVKPQDIRKTDKILTIISD